MDELTQEGFAHLVEALDRQAEYLKVLNEKQDAQGAQLASVDQHVASLDRKQDAVLEQLRALNDNIVRGFTQRDEWGGALTRRVDALEEKVKALEARTNGS